MDAGVFVQLSGAQVMAKFDIPLRIVLYQEDSRWVAHCLEFNILGDGDTRPDANRVAVASRPNSG